MNDNKSNTTVSEEMHIYRAHEANANEALIIDKVVTPILYVIGIVGNSIATYVWLRRRMRKSNSSAFYLCTLSINDLLFLIIHIFYELRAAWGYSTYDVMILCEIYNVILMIPQYFSPLLVLAFTLERFLSICHPFEGERLCKSSRTCKLITCILLFATVISLPQAYFWNIDENHHLCDIRTIYKDAGVGSFYSVWTWTTDMAIFGLVPLVVLVLNMCVLREIWTVEKRYKSQQQALYSSSTSRCTAPTLTLLYISFYLIITTLPVAIVFALQSEFVVESEPIMPVDELMKYPEWRKYFEYFVARKVIEEIGMSHHACNIFIYYFTGVQFRQEILRVILKVKQQRTSSYAKTFPTKTSKFTPKITKASSRNNICRIELNDIDDLR